MKIEFQFIGGPCFLLKINTVFTLCCDPVLKPEGTDYDFRIFKSRRVIPPEYNEDTFKKIDLWLITHGHLDHIDSVGVSKIHRDTPVILEKNAGRFFKTGFTSLHFMNWGDEKTFTINTIEISVKAVPAFHGSNFLMKMLAGKVNAYLITINDGNDLKRVYISSDTVYDKRITECIGREKIDYMIANLGDVQSHMFGGPLTLDIPLLKKLESDLKPGKVIPVHFNDFTHYTTDPKEIERDNYIIYKKGLWHTL